MGWLQWLRAFHAGPLSGLHRWPKECFAIECGPLGGPLQRVRQPLWCYRADPFVLRYQERLWLFYEEYQYLRNKGRLGVCEVDSRGSVCGPHQTILDLPYHLSYPFVFEADQQIWMVPESRANGTVDLYRAELFPLRWEKVVTLLRTDACDSTLHFREGLWWLFTALRRDDRYALGLFSSPQLVSSRWEPHPLNEQQLYSELPNGSARPGGSVFEHAGQLYRVSQWNPDYYGQGSRIMRVHRLNREEFMEEPADLPDLPTRRNHHLCVHSGLVAIDRRERVSFWPWIRPRPVP